MTRRYTAPEPFEELDHTADVGIRVTGDSAEEALARLVLGFATLLSGGGEVRETRELHLTTEPGEHTFGAVDVLRELLYRFDHEHVIPASVEVRRFDETGADVLVGVGAWDASVHEEGTELKAVTLHEAKLAREGGEWVAQIVFDV